MGWTLLTTDHPLSQALALAPNWCRAYSDPLATIYERVGRTAQ